MKYIWVVYLNNNVILTADGFVALSLLLIYAPVFFSFSVGNIPVASTMRTRCCSAWGSWSGSLFCMTTSTPTAPSTNPQRLMWGAHSIWNSKSAALSDCLWEKFILSFPDERLYKGPEGAANRQRRRPSQCPQVRTICGFGTQQQATAVFEFYWRMAPWDVSPRFWGGPVLESSLIKLLFHVGI